jgi:GNAT superfamily N-acetyltransferase
METRLDIRTLDPHDDRQMHRFHEILWRAEKEDGRSWNSCWTFDELASVFREPTADRRMDGCCVFEDGRMLAAGVLQLSLLDNLDKGYVFPAVEPALRGHGLGGAVLEGLVERAREAGRTRVLGDSALPYAERRTSGVLAFADRHGFRLANTEVYRVLRLPVAGGLLDELADEAARHHDGYVLERYVDELPERYLPSYCHLVNRLAVDAPTGDVDFEAAGVTPEIQRAKLQRSRRIGRTTFLSVAVRGGEVVAHSDLVVPPSGTEAHQMGTLVRRDHRGHRLGTAVKVANLRALQDARPDVAEVHTQNAETNRWMVDINVRLGFEPVGVCPDFVREL